MASIKRYFRTTLIGLATFILTSLSVQTESTNLNKFSDENFDDDNDLHMFI